MRTSSSLPILAFLAAALLSPSLARAEAAEPSAADKATARALLDEGDVLLRKGNVQAAHDKYKAADAIMGVPTTGVALAEAQEKLGMLVEAADTLARVQRFPAKAGEPKAFTAARSDAEKKLALLSARIPSVTVALAQGTTATDAMVVSIDGVALPMPGRFLPRKVNPGVHEIAIDDGARRGSASAKLAERESRTVEVALPPGGASSEGSLSSSSASAGTSAGADASPKETPKAPPPETSRRVHPGVWIGIGLAGAGLVAGGVTGGLAVAKKGTVEDLCPSGACGTTEGADALDSATALAHASTASFVLAGAGAATAVLTWALTKDTTAQGAQAWAPLVGPGFLGLRGSF